MPVDAGGPSNLDGVTTAAADTDARLANSGERHAKDEAKDNGASGAWWKRLRCVAAEKLASLRGGMVSVGTAREASGTSHGMASPRGGGGEILKQLVFAALVQNALCQVCVVYPSMMESLSTAAIGKQRLHVIHTSYFGIN